MMEANELYDLAQTVYAGKIWHALACPQKCRKMPKTTILVIFSKNYHRIVLNFCIVMETNELYDLAQAVYAGKILHALGMPMKML